MARLIDADALKERAIRVSTVKEHCYMKAVGTKEIDKAPTIDAVPVVHGRWRKFYTCSSERLFAYRCDQCNKENGRASYYCPNCGARMDGDSQ